MPSVNWREHADNWFGGCCCSFGGASEKLVNKYVNAYTCAKGVCYLSSAAVTLCKEDLSGLQFAQNNGIPVVADENGLGEEVGHAEENCLQISGRFHCESERLNGNNEELRFPICVEKPNYKGAEDASILASQPMLDLPEYSALHSKSCDSACHGRVDFEEVGVHKVYQPSPVDVRSKTREVKANQRSFLNGFLGDGFMVRSQNFSTDIEWKQFTCHQCSTLLGAYPCSSDDMPIDDGVRLFKCYIATSVPVRVSEDLFRWYSLDGMFVDQVVETAKDELSYRTLVRDLKTKSPLLRVVILNWNSWHCSGTLLDQMFSQLLTIIDLAIRQTILSNDNFETEFGHVPPVLRTVLEVLPLLSPTEQISSMWLVLLRELLLYLPRSDSSISNEEDEAKQADTSGTVSDNNMKRKNQMPNGTATVEPKMAEFPPQISGSTPSEVAACPSYLFAEKLVPVVVDLFLQVPVLEKYIVYPEIIQSLGRCMTTRRDNPDGSLWRVAVEGFNHVLLDDICKYDMTFVLDSKVIRPARVRVWKEVADVYEVFLVGHCGRPIPSHSLSAVALKADEALEMNILNILGDKILRSVIDAPLDSLQRLVSTIDCCASRTCSLPVQTVELMPSHCSRFSLMCLQKLFSLSSYDEEASDWNATRSEVSKISIMVLMARCEHILSRFLIDENIMGEQSLPMTRREEIIYVLQELARLKVHPETSSALPLHAYLRNIPRDLQNHDNRPHLLVLFPSFCELVTTREERVRELVQVLLRLVTRELALDRVSISK